MIISHQYKFIFLKTSKTAGTSVEIALSKFCGEDDVITENYGPDEELRTQLGYRGPQNCEIPMSQYSLKDWARTIKERKKRIFYNHIPGKDVKRIIGDEIWNSYYKFAFERNPYDRVASLYYWRFKGDPQLAVSDFVNYDKPKSLRKKGLGIYGINDEIAVDRVCFFESLQKDLDEVAQHLGLPDKLELPNAKGGFRPKGKTYQELFSEDDRGKIAKLFAKEIELFNYQF